MIVKKKTRETTALEKRNTSIMQFLLIALIPLLLVLVIGFSMGNTTAVNVNEYQQKVMELSEINRLSKEEVAALRDEFQRMDTAIVNRFITEDIDRLRTELEQIPSGDQFRLDRWAGRLDDVVEDFKRQADNFGRDLRFQQHDVLGIILNTARGWLKNLGNVQRAELLVMKSLKSRQTDDVDVAALQANLDALQNELNKKEIEITSKDSQIAILQIQLDGALDGGSGGTSPGAPPDPAVAELDRVRAENTRLKQQILPKLDRVDAIVNNIKVSGFFSNKSQVEGDLNRITDAIGDARISTQQIPE